jgi:hypothetical protein
MVARMGLPLTMKPSCRAINPWHLGEGERAFGVAMAWLRPRYGWIAVVARRVVGPGRTYASASQ